MSIADEFKGTAANYMSAVKGAISDKVRIQALFAASFGASLLMATKVFPDSHYAAGAFLVGSLASMVGVFRQKNSIQKSITDITPNAFTNDGKQFLTKLLYSNTFGNIVCGAGSGVFGIVTAYSAHTDKVTQPIALVAVGLLGAGLAVTLGDSFTESMVYKTAILGFKKDVKSPLALLQSKPQETQPEPVTRSLPRSKA
jgi:cytochrome c biogenesis protein CcdA